VTRRSSIRDSIFEDVTNPTPQREYPLARMISNRNRNAQHTNVLCSYFLVRLATASDFLKIQFRGADFRAHPGICSAHQNANSENDATECSWPPLACTIAEKLSIEGDKSDDRRPGTDSDAFGSARAFFGRCPQ
jgi:hypothetical protein